MRVSIEQCNRPKSICRAAIVTLLLLASHTLAGQSLPPLRIVADLSGGVMLHVPAFSTYEAAPSFTFGLSTGADIHIAPDWRLGMMAGVNVLSGLMQANELVLLNIDNDPVPATIRHTLQTELYGLHVEPTIEYATGIWRIRGGIRAGYLFGGTVTSSQQVIDPPGTVIDDDEQSVDSVGPYNGLRRFAAWATIGIGTQAKSMGRVRVEPGITVAIPIASQSAALPFTMWAASLQLRFSITDLQTQTIIRDTVITRDTLVIERHDITALMATKSVTSIDSVDEGEGDTVQRHFAIHESITLSIPLEPPVVRVEVNALFVDSLGHEDTSVKLRGTATTHDLQILGPLVALPEQSKSPTPLRDVWTVESLPEALLRYATASVEIAASRWKQHRRSISIRTYYRETASINSAKQRAALVQQQLVQAGVPVSAIAIAKPIPIAGPDWRYQCVEIDIANRTDDRLVSWTLDQFEACRLRFHSTVESDIIPKTWCIRLLHLGAAVDSICGVGSPPGTQDLEVKEDVMHLLRQGGLLNYALVVTSAEGVETTSTISRIAFEPIQFTSAATQHWGVLHPGTQQKPGPGPSAEWQFTPWSPEQERALESMPALFSEYALECRLYKKRY